MTHTHTHSSLFHSFVPFLFFFLPPYLASRFSMSLSKLPALRDLQARTPCTHTPREWCRATSRPARAHHVVAYEDEVIQANDWTTCMDLPDRQR